MSQPEESQLRVYRIADGHLADFVAEWRAGVLPLRQRFGFQIEAWTDAAESTFVWVVRYGGPGTLEDADRAVELGRTCAGEVAGRTGEEQLTICDLTGVGVQDVAAANAVLANAPADAGQWLDL